MGNKTKNMLCNDLLKLEIKITALMINAIRVNALNKLRSSPLSISIKSLRETMCNMRTTPRLR